MAYASVTDLEARWRTLSTAEKARAEVLLGDASARLAALYPQLEKRIATGDMDPRVPAQVVCSMVQRSMGSTDVGANVQSVSETVGPFSQSIQYANPAGDLYLTKAEKTLLRGGAQTAFSVDIGGGKW